MSSKHPCTHTHTHHAQHMLTVVRAQKATPFYGHHSVEEVSAHTLGRKIGKGVAETWLRKLEVELAKN